MYLIVESMGKPDAMVAYDYPPDAELAIAFGRSVRARLKLQISLDTIAHSSGLPRADCLAALQFAEGPDWLKFRALVDEWPWPEIKRRIQLIDSCNTPPDEPSVVLDNDDRAVQSSRSPQAPALA